MRIEMKWLLGGALLMGSLISCAATPSSRLWALVDREPVSVRQVRDKSVQGADSQESQRGNPLAKVAAAKPDSCGDVDDGRASGNASSKDLLDHDSPAGFGLDVFSRRKTTDSGTFRLASWNPSRFGSPLEDWNSRLQKRVAPFQDPEAGGASQGNGGAPSMAEMAQKANNPLSDVWLLLMQNDYTYLDGDLISGTRQLNSFKVQPVMPIPILNDEWNLIFRPVFSWVSAPVDDNLGNLVGVGSGDVIPGNPPSGPAPDPFGRTTGFGDSALLTLIGPNRDDGWVYGGGVSQIFPTASDEVLGQEKWQAGPAAIAIRLGKESGGLGIENWNIGALAQHWWSYTGDGKRSETSLTDIQYFINWKLNETQLIGMTPNIRVNWAADRSSDRYSVPIGLGTIGLFKVGRLPVRWGIEAQYYIVQPDTVSQDWNIKVFFAPIILNPFKK